MEHYLMIARSVTYAQRMEKALSLAGIRSQIFRAPKELTSMGCAYAVRLGGPNLGAALAVLHRAGLDPIRIFISQPGGYREVLL